MKACPQFEERLIDAAADAAETIPAELAAHLSHCEACIERFARERQLFAAIDAGLAASVAAEPSPEFARRVMEQVSGEAERKLLAAIDAGIAQTVSGEPSPQFAAAVRSRIADEPPPRTQWFSFRWWVPAAGLAAASILIAMMLPVTKPQDRTAGGNPPLNARTAAKMEPPHTTGVTKETSVRYTAGKGHQARPRTGTEGTAVITAINSNAEIPEVLIPADERQVVVRFYRFVQEGRINTAQVLEANRVELAQKLGEMSTPMLVARSAAVKTLDLVDTPRSTSDEK